MKYNFKVRHTELPKAIEEYCEKRMQKIEKLVPETAYMEVEFIDEFGERGGLDKRVKVGLDIPGEKMIHMENSAASWEEAVDFLRDRLVHEITKLRDKQREEGRHPTKYKVAEEEERDAGEI